MTDRTVSRRRFCGALAALVGAPAVVPGRALGADGAVAASNRIQLACIGLGGHGAGHDMKAFLSLPDCRVAAVCDVDSQRQAAAKQHVDQVYGDQDCTTYGDFLQVLLREDIDAVHIATPDHWHVPMAVLACRHGKDVYCQKPLSLTVREARLAVEAARRYDRVFQMGTQNRSNPSARLACELVRNRRLGELQYIEVGTWGVPVPCALPAGPVPPHLDWDLFLGPAPWRPYHLEIHRPKGWIRFFDYSGGGVTDGGAHFFDLVQWALNTEDTGPVEITPLTAAPTTLDGYDPRSSRRWYVRYRYACGATVYRTDGDQMRLVGSEGSIELGRCAWAAIVKTDPPALAGSIIGPDEIHLRRSDHHYANFLECIRTRERPAADVELGCRAAIICHISNIAERLGRPLQWDPGKEAFIDDGEANRCLDRARRSPWAV